MEAVPPRSDEPTLVIRRKNRKLKQKRRVRLPSAWDLLAFAGRGVRGVAPALAALVVLAGVAAGARWGWSWLHTSPRFGLAVIDVAGNERVSREELLALAGVEGGENVFSLPLADVERGALRSPWIASARARRELPDRLVLEVTERRPIAVVLVDGVPYLAGADGRPFKRAAVDAGECEGLLVVSGLPRALFAANADAAAALVRDAIATTAAYQKNAERPPVGEARVERGGTTLFTLEGAVALRLGTARGDELAARLERFDAVWSALTPEERAAARTIHLDGTVRPERITVGMGGPR
jgi:cell division septal protein FtsQ